MKKLKLNLEDLKVESFETNPMQTNTGTVFGNLEETDTQPVEACGGGGGGGYSNPACVSVGCPFTIMCVTTMPRRTDIDWTCGCIDTRAQICQFTNGCPPYSQLGNCTRNYLC